jgi:hypothetical protein
VSYWSGAPPRGLRREPTRRRQGRYGEGVELDCKPDFPIRTSGVTVDTSSVLLLLERPSWAYALPLALMMSYLERNWER